MGGRAGGGEGPLGRPGRAPAGSHHTVHEVRLTRPTAPALRGSLRTGRLAPHWVCLGSKSRRLDLGPPCKMGVPAINVFREG